MCQIYASTEPTRYDSEARSLRIQGSVTSIRLEKEFWSILDGYWLQIPECAMTVPRYRSASVRC